MKTKLAFALSLVVAVCAGLAARAWAQRAAAAPAQEGPAMQLVGSTRDTNVYYVNFQGHNCFIASTRGGSGVSVSCLR